MVGHWAVRKAETKDSRLVDWMAAWSAGLKAVKLEQPMVAHLAGSLAVQRAELTAELTAVQTAVQTAGTWEHSTAGY
jgi:hypothetical protein